VSAAAAAGAAEMSSSAARKHIISLRKTASPAFRPFLSLYHISVFLEAKSQKTIRRDGGGGAARMLS
jgi:hypothetical protein